MNVRKLAELIAKVKRSMWGKSGLSSELARNMYLAENLIANGVEIPVRCKDCRNFGEDVGMSKDGIWARCFLHKRIMCEKDFCSYGERKEVDGE